MPILNYSTTVSVEKTLSEIQRLLVRHGARSIMLNYDEQGDPESVSFLVSTAFGDRPFRLPVNVEQVWTVLKRQYNAGKITRAYAAQDQAKRVAWRIIRTWLEAQLAIIESEMVSLE